MTTTMTDPKDTLAADLHNFYGTENWWPHTFVPCTFTDGVKYFADTAQAYWLIDAIMLEPAILKAMARQGITFITLLVQGDKGVLTAQDDLGIPPYFTRNIPFTTCPEGEWKFFFGGGVLMLPSEY